MSATETRIETESGGAKGDKLARFDQIPAGPMIELAHRYGLGSVKYLKKNGLDNWRNGYPFSLSMTALERHYYAFKNGEDNDATIYVEAGLLADGEDPLYDEEGKLRPGVSHLSAVIWHCMFLMHHLEENPDLDDRPTTVLKRNAAGLAPDENAMPVEMDFTKGYERIEEIRAEAEKRAEWGHFDPRAGEIVTLNKDCTHGAYRGWPANVIHAGSTWTVEVLGLNDGEPTGICLANLFRDEFIFPAA